MKLFRPFLKFNFSVILIYSLFFFCNKNYEKKKIEQLIQKNNKIAEKKKIKHIKKVFNISGSDDEVLNKYNNIKIFISVSVDKYNAQLNEYYNNHPEIRGILRITRWDPYEPRINPTKDYVNLNAVEYTKKIYDEIRINENDIK